MVQGNFQNGDYFIDAPGISQSALRAIVGVWINIWIATIALCIRFIFRSQVKKRITSGLGEVSLWRVSPAVTSSEAFELRGILARALVKGDFSFVIVSTFCIVTAIVGAAGTVISNHAVQNNTVVRNTVVQGRLVTKEHFSLGGALLQVSTRVDVLTKANAPLAELFDFAPSDDSQWTYEPNQWNNTWKGNCSFAKHEAVELVVYPTNSTEYQDEIPLLGNYIPSWATVDRSKQGVAYSGFYIDAAINGTGEWRDQVVTYVFGSAPADVVGFSEQNTNISIVNYLAHHIARDDPDDGTYLETSFRSDVHTVDCQFVNSVNGTITHDQASADGGSYTNAAGNVANVGLHSTPHLRPLIISCVDRCIAVLLWMPLSPNFLFDSQQDKRCYDTGRLTCLSKMRSTRIPWQGPYPSAKEWCK